MLGSLRSLWQKAGVLETPTDPQVYFHDLESPNGREAGKDAVDGWRG